MIIQRVLKSIWKEFVYGAHLVALTGPAVIVTIIILLEEKNNWELPLIAYLLVFLNYRYNYYKGIKTDSLTNPARADYLGKCIECSQGLIWAAFLVLLFVLFFFVDLKVVLFTIFLIIMGLCYTNLFKELTNKIMGLKNFYISISWALFVALVGFYYSDFCWSLLIVFLFIFLKGMLNTIFLDIKDIESDKREGLKTVPVVLGKERTLKSLHVLNFLSLLPIIIGVYFVFLPTIALILLIFYFYDFYYFKLVSSQNINIQKFSYISYIAADGEFLLWPIALFLAKAILLIF
ncbi:hypothetical protein AMJ48_02435 [Parcubacteria bacterium DG_74_1]|nr:MAG: hypothetical protein AMJ48_02435 [Parcubacteria bacterium DG_74_1]